MHDFTIWDGYKTRSWPTLHLIGERGVVRYSHAGEDAYRQTEDVLLRLLAERLDPKSTIGSSRWRRLQDGQRAIGQQVPLLP